MKIRQHIPNSITSLNIISGSLAILFAFRGTLTLAVELLLAAALFDFMDGFAARLLKAYSVIGKELDSLADMISFGLAPGIIMFMLLENSVLGTNVHADHFSALSITDQLTLSIALLIPVASALRLAKFNVDTRQSDSFIGLPTPANALFISSLALIAEHGTRFNIDRILLSTPTLIGTTLVLSYLMIAELPMFSLKIKNLNWKDHHIQLIFLIAVVLLLLTLGIYGLLGAMLLYILLSVFRSVKK